MKYFTELAGKGYEALAYSGDWWISLTFREQCIITAGLGLTAGSLVFGTPQLAAAALAALASNVMLWFLIEGDSRWSRFMRKFGNKLDAVLTIGGIGLGFLGGTVTGAMFGALFGMDFTACRTFAKTVGEFQAANDDVEHDDDVIEAEFVAVAA